MTEHGKKILKIALLGMPFIVVILSGTLIYRAQGGFWHSAEGGTMSVAGIYIGTTLLMVFATLFHRILYNRWYWASAVVLALIYAYVIQHIQYGIQYYKIILPILLYSILVTLLTVAVFYNRALIKFRTLLTALGGAAVFTVAMWIFYRLFAIEVEPGFVFNRFVSGLYLFIFLGVGMSISDMIIYKIEIKELQSQESIEADDDEDDEKLEG